MSPSLVLGLLLVLLAGKIVSRGSSGADGVEMPGRHRALPVRDERDQVIGCNPVRRIIKIPSLLRHTKTGIHPVGVVGSNAVSRVGHDQTQFLEARVQLQIKRQKRTVFEDNTAIWPAQPAVRPFPSRRMDLK